MKKILIVNASNRRRGNSFALEDYLKKKLEGKAEVKTLETANQKVNACLACDACKRQHTPNCIQKDDFTALIPEIDSCDGMIILSPVHWDQFPAQLKAFLDRTYSFMDFTQPDFSMATRKDKKLAGFSRQHHGQAGRPEGSGRNRRLDPRIKIHVFSEMKAAAGRDSSSSRCCFSLRYGSRHFPNHAKRLRHRSVEVFFTVPNQKRQP